MDVVVTMMVRRDVASSRREAEEHFIFFSELRCVLALFFRTRYHSWHSFRVQLLAFF